MSNFSNITEEETAKFVMIIESIISNCEKLFSEIFDGQYELNDLLRTIGLGEFTSGSKRLDGNLTLIYDRYKANKMTKGITEMCYNLWDYINPAREKTATWDIFSQITNLKNKYRDNHSLCGILDSLHMSLTCFVQTSQLYFVTRELANTKESVKKEIDMLKGELERTKSELAETRERERKSDLEAASELDNNAVDLRTLLSRMKCLEA
jgi:hypothetical protein